MKNPIRTLYLLLLINMVGCGTKNGNDDVTVASEKATSPEKMAAKVVGHFAEEHQQFATPDDAWGGYAMDFTFEAMLVFDEVRGENEYTPMVLKVMETRGLSPSDTIPYRAQPFCAVNFALWRVTQNDAYRDPFVYESEKMRREVSRSPEGAITHKFETPGRYLLIDYLKEYGSRMTKAGHLSGDTSFFREAPEQYEIYRQLLRDPETGLYHNGRGWLDDPMELSPGAWSRGHGWLIHGLVDAMQYTPQNSENFRRLQTILQELATDLLRYQDKSGMWHQLLHLPFEDSYPESSGTGLIAYNIARSLNEGFLKGKEFERSARQAFTALHGYVDEDGVVLGTCKGPGTLYSIENYYRKPAAPGDHHGPPTMIFAMAGEILLENLGNQAKSF